MKTISRTRAQKMRTPIAIALACLVAGVLTTGASAAIAAPTTSALDPNPALGGGAGAHLSVDGRVADRNSLRGDGVSARGVATGLRSGSGVARLQVRRVGARSWRQVKAARIHSGRKFSIRWRGGAPGRYLTRLVVRNAGAVATDHLGAVYVYRATFASWYGPGFLGHRTACGQRLTSSILGVAHKTLPCGTRVTFHLRGRTVTARVIDRGPYAQGRDWDLTPALKRKLHFGSTGVVHTTS